MCTSQLYLAVVDSLASFFNLHSFCLSPADEHGTHYTRCPSWTVLWLTDNLRGVLGGGDAPGALGPGGCTVGVNWDTLGVMARPVWARTGPVGVTA